MEWNSFAFISFICFLLSASSAVLSFASRKKGAPFLYGAMAVILALWSLGLAFGFAADTPESALIWIRSANYVVVFLPALIFHFTVSFVDRLDALRRVVSVYYSTTVVYLICILSAPASFLYEPTYRLDQFWFPMGGTLFYFFPALFTLVVGHAVNVLRLSRVGESRGQKLKIDYLLATIIIGLLGGGLSISLEFKIDIPPYGVLSVAFMVVISTYAVLRHELLEFPETLSIVAARSMTYICVFAFMVLMLEIAKYAFGVALNNTQVLVIGLATVLSAEMYSAIKGKIQSLSNQLLMKRKVSHDNAFRLLMHRLDQASNVELMLPLLRSYLEDQPYLYHYAWYLDQSLLEQNLKNKNTRPAKALENQVYQRVLFSTHMGRRHDRLPSILRLNQVCEGGLGDARSQLVGLLSSEQLDVAYRWIEKVPGREMLGLPVIANDRLRGMILVVVNKNEISRSQQDALQALSSKLADIVERIEFYRQQSQLEQRFLLEKMASMKSLANSIGHEIQPSLLRMEQFVSFVEQTQRNIANRDVNTLDVALHCKQAKSAIARSSQAIDMTLSLLEDNPVDVSKFRLMSIQTVVNKALANYEFLVGERDVIETELRQNFVFKGDETLLTYAIFNLLKLILAHSGVPARKVLKISSEIEANGNVLVFSSEGLVFIKEDELSLEGGGADSDDMQLELAFCQRVMRAFGGELQSVASENEYSELRLVFKPVVDAQLKTTREVDLEAS